MSRLQIECANVTAPLDYTSQEYNETITLELIRVPAAKQPSKGTCLTLVGLVALAAAEWWVRWTSLCRM